MLAGLDLSHQHAALASARRRAERGLGVLAVLHDLKMAAHYADRVAIIEGGRLTALGPAATTLDPALLSAVFATPILRLQAGAAVRSSAPVKRPRSDIIQPGFNRCYNVPRRQQRHRWANDPP